MSWTGGKDSCLALHEAEKLGCKIKCLVTFAPIQERSLAHPLDFMAFQAQALDLPHYVIGVKEPFDRSYENAISSLKEQRGIDTLATGDIGEVAGHDPNWLMDRSRRCGVDVLKPLWHHDRIQLLNRVLSLKIKVVFSCVRRPWFTEEWLGMELSASSVRRLGEMSKRTGLDICGENGEYHTMALDGPQFKKTIRVGSYSRHVADSTMYIALENPRLEDKDT
jgi:diphthine-ammonia ligase